jgi:hypothetical protein
MSSSRHQVILRYTLLLLSLVAALLALSRALSILRSPEVQELGSSRAGLGPLGSRKHYVSEIARDQSILDRSNLDHSHEKDQPRANPSSIPIISVPSNKTPVVFFHPRKSGGSSIRTLLLDRALRVGVPERDILLPCTGHPKSKCDVYTINNKYSHTKRYALIGGHLFWGAQQRLAPFEGMNWHAYAHRRGEDLVPPAALAATETLGSGDFLPDRDVAWQCITIIREPLSRATSCYYYRHKGLKPMSSLAPTELQEIMLYGRDEFGHTCSNEMARIFCGIQEEWIVSQPGPWSEGFHAALLHRAATNMGRCIILDLEDMEGNQELLSHWAPWIVLSGLGHEKKNVRYPHEELKPELQQALSDANGADIRLYKYAQGFRREQLDYVRSIREVPRQ